MNPEKIERARGDLNLDMNSLNNLRFQSKYISEYYSSMNSSENTKTKSLSFISDKQKDLNPDDIIPFYNQREENIFQNSTKRKFIYSEMKEYDNIEQIQNQRILIQQNASSEITCAMDVIASQLMVIKKIKTFQLENTIQKLDEYKIHYNMNQQYPQISLKLSIPVNISKSDQNYSIMACMERAQFNLYDYSRKYQISQEYAQYILFLILQQIVDMHSINIAHRDVKPQNIFYVLGKGWLLSDFGESQVYQEVDSLYNIRGTIYFFLPSLKSQIDQNNKVKQNLLYNDIYALVISIIMIQSQEYITNIQEEIEYLNDQLFQELLKIKCLNDVRIFLKLNNIQMVKKFVINESPIYMNLNQYDTQLNQNIKYQSYIQLYCLYNQNKVKIELAKQLLELIQKQINQKQIMTLEIDTINILYRCFFHGFYFNQMAPSRYVKYFNEYNLEKQKLIVHILYQFGFNEKTIYYGKKILKQSYCQDIHLKIISCYLRMLMHEIYENELILFRQQLQFNQLDTNCQSDILLITSNLIDCREQGNNQNYDYFQNISKSLQDCFESDCLGNMSKIQFIQYFEKFQNYSRFSELIRSMDSFSIELQLQFIKQVFLVVYIGYVDKNVRATFLQDLLEIYYLLNLSQLKMQSVKKIKKEMFDPDSFQQSICYLLQIQITKITFKKIKKIQNLYQLFQKILQSIQNIKRVTIIRYQCTLAINLLNLVNGLDMIKQYNHQIVYIIQFAIQYFHQNNYLNQYDIFIQNSNVVERILFELRSYKRILAFINKYDLRSNLHSKQFISRIQDNLILGGLKSNLQNKYYDFRKTLHQKFIFQQYLDRF